MDHRSTKLRNTLRFFGLRRKWHLAVLAVILALLIVGAITVSRYGAIVPGLDSKHAAMPGATAVRPPAQKNVAIIQKSSSPTLASSATPQNQTATPDPATSSQPPSPACSELTAWYDQIHTLQAQLTTLQAEQQLTTRAPNLTHQLFAPTGPQTNQLTTQIQGLSTKLTTLLASRPAC